MNLETRVSQLMEPYTEAWNKGDLDAFASFWTEDGILWSALGEELRGRAAIRAWAASQFHMTLNLVLEPTHSDSFVEVIFVVGNYACQRTQPGPPNSRGGFTALLRETGDRKPRMHRLVAFPKVASTLDQRIA